MTAEQNWQTSPRGFGYVEIPFQDYRHSQERNLSIQESSAAGQRKLWVGFDELNVDLTGDGDKQLMPRGHLDEAIVRKLRDVLTDWLGDAPQETPMALEAN